MVTVAKKFTIRKAFDGLPKSSDLTLVEENLPPVMDGRKYFLITPHQQNGFAGVGVKE